MYGLWFTGKDYLLPSPFCMGARRHLHTSRPELFLTNIRRFCIGTYNSLLTLPIISMGVSGDVGRRIGMFMSITAIGALVGPPISGTINSITGGYKWVGTYAGIFPRSTPFTTHFSDMHLGSREHYHACRRPHYDCTIFSAAEDVGKILEKGYPLGNNYGWISICQIICWTSITIGLSSDILFLPLDHVQLG